MIITIENTEIVKAAAQKSDVPEIFLSENDNAMVRNYMRMVYFFINKNNQKDFMPEEALKSSLVETLSDFPEFCGQLSAMADGSLKVICNNAGVQWIRARGQGSLSEVQESNLPYSMVSPPEPGPGETFLEKIQYTRCTEDNSIILCVLHHHSIADAHGFFRFMQHWAHHCTGKLVNQVETNHAISSHDINAMTEKPQIHHPPGLRIASEKEKEEMIAKIVRLSPQWVCGIFSADKDRLKQSKVDVFKSQQENGILSEVSTNDAVCALLWSAVCRAGHLPYESSVHLYRVANVRKRRNPPIPDTYTRNSVFALRTSSSVQEMVSSPGSLGLVAAKIRSTVDGCTAETIQSWLNWVSLQKNKSQIVPSMLFCPASDDSIFISSLTRFPVYEVDFGYGYPEKVRVGSTQPLNNGAFLLHSLSPLNGIEINLYLHKDQIEKVASDSEFSRYFTFLGYTGLNCRVQCKL